MTVASATRVYVALIVSTFGLSYRLTPDSLNRMTAPGVTTNEDEFLDDPIKLCFEHNTAEASDEIDGNVNKNSAYEDKTVTERSYSDIIQLVKPTKSDCIPFKITLVDCAKFPWYYKRYKNRIIEQLDCLQNTKDDSFNDTDSVIYIGDSENDDCLTVESSKPLVTTTQHKHSNMKPSDNVKLKAEIEKALQKKHQSKIDLRRNVGLVGLVIEHKIIEPDVLMDGQDSVPKLNDSFHSIDSISSIESYLDAASKVLNDCETDLIRILEGSDVTSVSTQPEKDKTHDISYDVSKTLNTNNLKENVVSESEHNTSKKIKNSQVHLNSESITEKNKSNAVYPNNDNNMYKMSGAPQNVDCTINNNTRKHLHQKKQSPKKKSKELINTTKHQEIAPNVRIKNNNICDKNNSFPQTLILGSKPNPSLPPADANRSISKSRKLKETPKNKITKKKTTRILEQNSSNDKAEELQNLANTKNISEKNIQRNNNKSAKINKVKNPKKFKGSDEPITKPNQLHYYSLSYCENVKNNTKSDAGAVLNKSNNINVIPKSRIKIFRIIRKPTEDDNSNTNSLSVIPIQESETNIDLPRYSVIEEKHPNDLQNGTQLQKPQPILCILSKPADGNTFNTGPVTVMSDHGTNIHPSKINNNRQQSTQNTPPPTQQVFQGKTLYENNSYRPIPVLNLKPGPLSRKYNPYRPFNYVPPRDRPPQLMHINKVTSENSSQRLTPPTNFLPPHNTRLTTPNVIRKSFNLNYNHNFPNKVNSTNYFSALRNNVPTNNSCKPVERINNLRAPMHSSAYVASSFSESWLPMYQPTSHAMPHLPSNLDPRISMSSTKTISVSNPSVPPLQQVSSMTTTLMPPPALQSSLLPAPPPPPPPQPPTNWLLTSAQEQRSSHITEMHSKSNSNYTNPNLRELQINTNNLLSTKKLMPDTRADSIATYNERKEEDIEYHQNNVNFKLNCTPHNLCKPNLEDNSYRTEIPSAILQCNETKKMTTNTLDKPIIEHVKTKTEMLEELDKDITIEETDWENRNMTQNCALQGTISKEYDTNKLPEIKMARLNQATGYSPPILPIPSTIELLEKVQTSPTVIKNELMKLANSSSSSSNIKVPSKAPCDNKIKPKKRDDVRKISLDEYKKRKAVDGNVEEPASKITRKRHCDKKHAHKRHKHRNHSVESDLGYDSDTTVII